MMTNANIAKLEEVGNDRVLKLNYSGGEQTISVPEGATIVEFDKAGRDQLVPGRRGLYRHEERRKGSRLRGHRRRGRQAAHVESGWERHRPGRTV